MPHQRTRVEAQWSTWTAAAAATAVAAVPAVVAPATAVTLLLLLAHTNGNHCHTRPCHAAR